MPELISELFDQVRDGNLEGVKSAIQAGADVNARDRYGRTPLFVCDDVEVARVLIDHGADVNARTTLNRIYDALLDDMVQNMFDHELYVDKEGKTCYPEDKDENEITDPVEYMRVFNNYDIEEQKGKINDNFEFTPLHTLQMDVHIGLDVLGNWRKINKDYASYLRYIDKTYIPEELEDLFNVDTIKHPFMCLSSVFCKPERKFVKNVLQFESLLCIKISLKTDALAKLLIESGADIYTKDFYGRNLLFYAKSVDFIQYLIDHGLDAEQSADRFGRTPLSFAAQIGNIDFIRMMAENMDINKPDRFGLTLLNYCNDLATAEYLIEAKGADVMRRSSRFDLLQNLLSDEEILDSGQCHIKEDSRRYNYNRFVFDVPEYSACILPFDVLFDEARLSQVENYFKKKITEGIFNKVREYLTKLETESDAELLGFVASLLSEDFVSNAHQQEYENLPEDAEEMLDDADESFFSIEGGRQFIQDAIQDFYEKFENTAEEDTNNMGEECDEFSTFFEAYREGGPVGVLFEYMKVHDLSGDFTNRDESFDGVYIRDKK